LQFRAVDESQVEIRKSDWPKHWFMTCAPRMRTYRVALMT
jgi:hypothetical protein